MTTQRLPSSVASSDPTTDILAASQAAPAPAQTQTASVTLPASEGHDKALKAVNVDEPRTQVYPGRVGGEQEKRWYLDSDASNHMMGSKVAFSKLDSNVTGTVKFGDGSRVAIRGRDTIIFRYQNGEHYALTDVYYIPQLRSSIISIGQLDERGSKVLIKEGVLKIRDREQRLLAKVKRS
ncbi:uncharacterized protein [Miscanthus floridulus]|uniref:uncharacterized protein n=1 Tax=Miscanthus floridulus TaxID=154761 RepID=UPI00345AF4D4